MQSDGMKGLASTPLRWLIWLEVLLLFLCLLDRTI
jgi:hypothetical protein